MKKSKLQRILALLMSCILLVGATLGTQLISSAVEDGAPEYAATVDSTNVEFGGMLHLAIKATNNTDGGKLGIYVYEYTDDYATRELELVEPIYKTFKEKTVTSHTGNEITYFATQGIAAKDIAKDYVIVAVIDNGGEITFGQRLAYSVARYVADRADDEGVTAEQKNLYEKLLTYGEAADTVLNPKN